MSRLADQLGEQMSPHIRQMIDWNWTAEHFVSAVRARKNVVRHMARLMSSYELLVSPAAAVLPFAAERLEPDGPVDWTPFALPPNLTGQPAASLPCGWTESGLPVGIQIAGRHLEDRRVLQVAAAFQRVMAWQERIPPFTSGADLKRTRADREVT